MKILLVHNRYRSTAPSGENHVVDTEGAALAGMGHEVARFERSSDDIARWSAARKAALPARVIWSRQAHRELAAVLRDSRPDVVHLHNTFPLLSPAVLYACRDAGVPVVATLHNYRLACVRGDFFRDGGICHDCAQSLPFRAIQRGCYRGSRTATLPVAVAASVHRPAWRSLVSAYIFVSAPQQELLAGVRLNPDRLFVKHNLVFPRASRRPEREPMLVYAGRIDEAKGIRVLMSGWDRYRQLSASPGLTLAVAGAGPLEPELRSWAASRPSVTLLGHLSPDACAALVARARALIIPSAWEEAFGLIAVEAMAVGVPSIAANHGSFADLIADGRDGILFSASNPAALGHAIAQADSDPARYDDLGARAFETYQARFAPLPNLEQLIAIYRFAIEGRRPESDAVPGRSSHD